MQWQVLIAVCLIAGLVFRSVNLNQKVYWYDEAFTFLRLSGYSEAEAVRSLTTPDLVEPKAFQTYRQLNFGKGVADTVRGLAIEEPQHTPLYYVLGRLWAGLFGDSVATVRALSVVLSILALPCMAWLCWELYQSAWAGWLGMALLAVSPFHIVYAQEARPTALWATTILLSSAALLRALRVKSSPSWLIYALALTLNLYAFLFSGLVAIAHAMYVVGMQRGRWTLSLQKFSLALLISLIAFSPWLAVIASNSSQVSTATDWLAGEAPLNFVGWIRLWAYHLILPFVDRGDVSLPIGLRWLFVLLQMIVRLSVLWGLYLLIRQTRPRTWLFVVLLATIPAIALTVPDLLLGGKRSTVLRYLVPTYIGFQLIITYLLTQYLVPVMAELRWQQRFWRAVMATIITAGILSSTLIAQSPAWWNKGSNSRLLDVTAQINQTERPLVVSNADLGDLLSLSYYLEPKVRLLIYPACFACKFNQDQINRLQLPEIPAGFSDVFLYNPRPSEPWLSQLHQQKTYSVETLSEVKSNWNTEYWLWRIKPSKAANQP